MKMEIQYNKDEQEKHQSQKCFFNIEVERINHIKPDSTKQNPNRKVSVSEKYLTVLEESTRIFLGIKRCYKRYNNYLRDFILSNEEVNVQAKKFLGYYEKPEYIQMDINDKKNQFYSMYYGIKLFELFKILEKDNNIWEQKGTDEITHQRFMNLLKYDDF